MDGHLSSEQLSEFRQQLKQRYRDLWQDIRRELAKSDAESYQAITPEAPDLEDQSLGTLLVDLNHADVHRDIQEMRDVQAALGRISDGSYGHCSSCGQSIPLERLRVNPTAERCIACQTRWEETHMPGKGASL